MAVREVESKYKGSIFGLVWSILTPLSMLAVYTLVFMGIFGARWPGIEQQGGFAFAIQVFAGLTIFNIFAEVLQRSPGLLSENPNLIKKVVFPVETLVTISMLASLFNFGIQFILLVIAMAIADQYLTANALYIPLVMLPLLILSLGLALILASIGIFIKDLRLIMGSIVSLLLFVSPVFFPIEMVKQPLAQFLMLNPIATVITNFRGVLFANYSVDWLVWSITLLISLAALICGTWLFYRLRPGFSDVI